MSEPMGTGTEIYDATKNCLELFSHNVKTESSSTSMIAHSLHQRFKVWASYSGATARLELSLDARLEDLWDVKTAMLGLIRLIIAQLNKALSQPTQVPEPSVIESNGLINLEHPLQSNTNEVADDVEAQARNWASFSGSPWDSIARAIDMLLETTAIIREASSRSRSSQAPTTYKRDDDLYFMRYLETLLRREFPSARLSLIRHIAKSILARRRRILWHRHHVEKLNVPRNFAEGPDPLSVVVSRDSGQESLPKHIPRNIRDSKQRQLAHHSGPLPSSTNLSRPAGSQTIQRRTNAVSVVSGLTKGVIVQDRIIFAFPEPPALPEHESYARCPYCDKPLELKDLKDDRWRHHVHKDLDPLVCVSESCQETLKFFSNKNDWSNHMTQDHGKEWPQKIHMQTWLCEICTPAKEFFSVESYSEHLISHELSKAEIKVMSRHNFGVGERASGTCPLCETKVYSASILNATSSESDIFNDHIAAHLFNLSLLSVPITDASVSINVNENSAAAETESSITIEYLPPRDRGDVKIAVFCALSFELEMVRSLLDNEWEDKGRKYGKAVSDPNKYILGAMAGLNVVLVYYPPTMSMDVSPAASGLLTSFEKIELAFSVGVCGAAPEHPETRENIFLGDCIIGTEILQYNHSRPDSEHRILSRHHKIADEDHRSNRGIRSILEIASDTSSREYLNTRLREYLAMYAEVHPDFKRPDISSDRLYRSDYDHVSKGNCEEAGCQDKFLIQRDREDEQVKIHFGRIGSNRAHTESALERDRLTQEDELIAYDKENASVANLIPTIVIKSACDYADSHKDKRWKRYAALTAAAGLKAVLSVISAPRRGETKDKSELNFDEDHANSEWSGMETVGEDSENEPSDDEGGPAIVQIPVSDTRRPGLSDQATGRLPPKRFDRGDKVRYGLGSYTVTDTWYDMTHSEWRYTLKGAHASIIEATEEDVFFI